MNEAIPVSGSSTNRGLSSPFNPVAISDTARAIASIFEVGRVIFGFFQGEGLKCGTASALASTVFFDFKACLYGSGAK